MMAEERYASVRNAEGQYSVWALDRPIPDGWDADGFEGSKDECLDHIEEVWTDITPLSARRSFE